MEALQLIGFIILISMFFGGVFIQGARVTTKIVDKVLK